MLSQPHVTFTKLLLSLGCLCELITPQLLAGVFLPQKCFPLPPVQWLQSHAASLKEVALEPGQDWKLFLIIVQSWSGQPFHWPCRMILSVAGKEMLWMCGEGRSPCSPTLLSLLRQLMKMALWEFITKTWPFWLYFLTTENLVFALK